MYKSFHVESQQAFSTLPKRIREPESRMTAFSEVAGEFNQFLKMTKAQRRLFWLNIIQERRFRICQNPHHEWGVYELCKAVYELAEIDHVDFNGASVEEKIVFIRQLVPYVSSNALSYGVEEYHDSRARQGWTMNYLNEADVQPAELL